MKSMSRPDFAPRAAAPAAGTGVQVVAGVVLLVMLGAWCGTLAWLTGWVLRGTGLVESYASFVACVAFGVIGLFALVTVLVISGHFSNRP